MGAEAWEYFVPYEPDIGAALAKLRQREFEAGRFNGSETNPATPEEAFENTSPDGTRSILDITQVSEEPDFCSVAPLPRETLFQLYDTDKPTRAMIEANMDFHEDIERGQGIYIITYKEGRASEIFFAGYSFD